MKKLSERSFAAEKAEMLIKTIMNLSTKDDIVDYDNILKRLESLINHSTKLLDENIPSRRR